MSMKPNCHDVESLLPKEEVELLNDIDGFRQDGLDNLPQFVVCGDRGSGKSSVLEALSGVSFPADCAVGRRFATAIALRYDAGEGVTGEASIAPSPRATEAHRAQVESFHRSVESLDGIAAIAHDAQGRMGVGDDGGISEDVLHLKLKGRTLPNLTLVDLPGLVQASGNADESQQATELAKQYLRQENSIILVIVSADKPIQEQQILTMSHAFDPSGSRSIGVITKPDLLMEPEQTGPLLQIMELVTNNNLSFRSQRPWYVVRCLRQAERRAGMDRSFLESSLLGTQPWNRFPQSRLGVQSLRASLCNSLRSHIITVLPALADSLEKKVSSIKSAPKELGPARATTTDQMQYLTRISERYSQLVDDALAATYTDPFFNGDDSSKMLRTVILTLTDKFDLMMRTKAHAYEISNIPKVLSAGSSTGGTRVDVPS